jgi:hypothetical protein
MMRVALSSAGQTERQDLATKKEVMRVDSAAVFKIGRTVTVRTMLDRWLVATGIVRLFHSAEGHPRDVTRRIWTRGGFVMEMLEFDLPFHHRRQQFRLITNALAYLLADLNSTALSSFPMCKMGASWVHCYSTA